MPYETKLLAAGKALSKKGLSMTSNAETITAPMECVVRFRVRISSPLINCDGSGPTHSKAYSALKACVREEREKAKAKATTPKGERRLAVLKLLAESL